MVLSCVDSDVGGGNAQGLKCTQIVQLRKVRHDLGEILVSRGSSSCGAVGASDKRQGGQGARGTTSQSCHMYRCQAQGVDFVQEGPPKGADPSISTVGGGGNSHGGAGKRDSGLLHLHLQQ